MTTTAGTVLAEPIVVVFELTFGNVKDTVPLCEVPETSPVNVSAEPAFTYQMRQQ